MRRICLVLLAACKTPEPTPLPCESPADPPSCEIGWYDDQGGYVALVDGQDLPVWFGLQGGMHIEMIVHDQSVTPVVRVSAIATDGGDRISIDGPIDTVTDATEPTCAAEHTGVRAVLDTSDGFVRACGLDGHTVDLEVTIERQDGEVATCTAQVTATIDDFVADQCSNMI
ncbi:MAG: hypothetical protein H6737_14840 [Alphaproteobacteria bacterium]|nr:hypothetical protein [Alphaproteobacteria bacterium]